MELNEILKQFKKIESNHEYKAKSRAVILASHQDLKTQSLWRPFLISEGRFGASLVMTSIIIVALLGGFSIKSTPDSGSFPGLDLAGIEAEAQAIDIQIQLTSLNYEEYAKPKSTKVVGALPVKKENTVANDDSALIAELKKMDGEIETEVIQPVGAEPGIDQALEVLAL